MVTMNQDLAENLRRPWKRLIGMIAAEVEFSDTAMIDKYLLAAVCIAESYGNAFWCECGTQYKRELNNLCTTTGLEPSAFARFLRVKSGRNQGSMPIFHFSAREWLRVNDCAATAVQGHCQRALLACKAGLVGIRLFDQMPVEELTFENDGIFQLLENEGSQVRWLRTELVGELMSANGDMGAALESYGRGYHDELTRDYAVRIITLAAQLREAWSIS
jgi:hypothetical protein